MSWNRIKLLYLTTRRAEPARLSDMTYLVSLHVENTNSNRSRFVVFRFRGIS